MKDFNGKIFTVLGSHGFIGSALKNEIINRGGQVTNTPTKESSAILHFASYTHIPFEKNVAYHTNELVSSLLYLFPFCKENNIPLIYPSSALVYEKPRPFYHFKKMLEEMQYIYNARSVALRIFPVYGIGEGNRGHATAIYQWIYDMTRRKRPVVYGDGTQKRSFTYITDVVDYILTDKRILGSKKPSVIDVGSGFMYSFNEIIKMINRELSKQNLSSSLAPIYKSVPRGYAKGVTCPNPIAHPITMQESIIEMINELKP